MTATRDLDPLVWRTDEAARLLTVSRTTVQNMVKSGELKGFRIGRRIVIPKVALERYLSERGEA